MRYNKRPITIDAAPVGELCHAASSKWSDLPAWVVAAYDKGEILFLNDGLDVKTLEGRVKAEMTDWLLQGIKGELYPCKPDIFAASYDPVDPAETLP